MSLRINSQVATPSAYEPFFKACAEVPSLAYETDAVSQSYPLVHKLSIQAHQIETVITSSFGRVKEIHQYARWMGDDHRMEATAGLLKTKEFVKEFFEKQGSLFYSAISALPEADFNACILRIRDRIRELSKGVSNNNHQREVVKQMTVLSPGDGLGLKFLFQQHPKIQVGAYASYTVAQNWAQANGVPIGGVLPNNSGSSSTSSSSPSTL